MASMAVSYTSQAELGLVCRAHGVGLLPHARLTHSQPSRQAILTSKSPRFIHDFYAYASAEDADRDVPSPLCGLSMLNISATQIEQLRVQAVCAMQAVGTHCAAANTLSLGAGALDSARPSGTPSTI